MAAVARRIAGASRPVLLALAVLLLTACQARLSLDVSVSPHGGGRLSVTLAADEALLAEAAAADVDPLAVLAANGRTLADEGWSVTETPDGNGGREVTLAADFDDPAGFNALATALADGLASPEVRLIHRLGLHSDGEVMRLDGEVGAEPGPAVAEYGLDPGEAAALVETQDAFVFDVTATLPGTVLETTAGDPEMPLRWQVPPGGRVEIVAVSELPAAPWWRSTLAAGALALLTTLGLAWAISRRHRRRRARARRRAGLASWPG